MAPPTPPHPPFPSPSGKGDRKRKRIADDGASPSDPPAALLPPQNMSTQVTDAAVSAIADKVGDLVGTLWGYSFGLVANIIFLSRKADEVAGEMMKLRSLQDDLMHRAKVSNQLEQWVSRVRSLAEDAAKFQRSLEDRSTTFTTRFRLGYDAVELLKQARKLAEEGNLFSGGAPQLIRPRGPDPVEQVPSETTSSTLVGGREALERVQRHIMDDGVGIIGIYGMGGVGKTTLKIINNEFLREQVCGDKFDVAIWVTVSRDVQISNIRETVAGRLGLPSHTPKDELFRHLSAKRFVLLLDDVWEKLDLTEIGIPHPKVLNNGSKILFTTRYEQVCGEMDADQMVRINSLDDNSSWELFRSKLGREAAAAVLDDQSIQRLAKEVVRRCGGLPIALVTVGMAMSNAKTAYEWKDAIRKLDQCAAELSPGMEDDVLKSLKFSFEKLKDEAHRNCLLYCALFPEDYKISKEEIIDMWICEGFLDAENFDEDNIEDTRGRGNVLISELQKACLLEEGSDDDGTVKLHDTVRDMALWIAGHDFVVLAGRNSSFQLVPKPNIWENAKKISLMWNCNIKELPFSSFPSLTTLLLRYSLWGDKFLASFRSMPALRVLDLCGTRLNRFPIEITSLTSLQYLDLRNTIFNSLPVELGNLTNLRILMLRNTLHLTLIPAKAISRLSHLQVLDMMYSGYRFNDVLDMMYSGGYHQQQLDLSNLENLKRLSELYLPSYLRSWASLEEIAASPVLRRSTRNLDIRVISVSQPPPPPPPTGDTISERIGKLSDLRSLVLCAHPSDPVMGELQLYPIGRLHQNLEDLHIQHFKEAKFSIKNISCHGSETLFPRLRKLRIENCDGCSVLTWVGQLPCLETLEVRGCERLREVMMPLDGGGSHDHHSMTSFFPKLKDMILSSLPSLRSISTSSLLFPCLERLEVFECPRLQRPFGPLSAKNLRELKIDNCDGCSELTWVGQLPCLEKLFVRGCKGLREVMMPLDGGGSHDHHPIMPSSFPKLKDMILKSLPSLRSISTSSLLFPCLERLEVFKCPRLQRPFGPQSAKNLRELEIYNCDGWSELTWVGQLPCLEKLFVRGCKGLREVMMPLDGGGDHDHHPIMPSSFQKLKGMDLEDLPSLRSISTGTLRFLCLEWLQVQGCPRLQRLPFGPQSAKNLHIIRGPKAWWDGLEWDDGAHQQSFRSKFVAL